MSKDYGNESNKITLREFKGINCDGAAIIESFSGGGKTLSLSQMVGVFLVEELNLPLIGDITSIYFPPLAIVRKGQSSHSCRIYGNKDLVVFVSDYKFGPEISNSIIKAIFDFAQRHQTSEIILMKGIEQPVDDKKKEEEIGVELKKEKPKTKEELMELLFQTKKKKERRKIMVYNK